MKKIASKLKSKLPKHTIINKTINMGRSTYDIAFKEANLLAVPHMMQGLYFYQLQDYEVAQAHFLKALTFDPNNAYINFKLGMCFFKQARWSQAHHYIDKAVSLEPNQKKWHTQLMVSDKNMHDNTHVRLATTKENITNNPDSSETLLEYANSLFESKQYWMAKLQFQKYIELHTKDERVFEKLGIISEKLSSYQESIDYFSQASSLLPFSSNYKYRIGYGYEMLGDIQTANAYYDLAISFSNPNHEVHLFGIGVFHAKRGLWDKALSAYKQFAEKTQSKNPELYYRIGIAYERMYNWQEAGESFAKSIKLSPIINSEWCFKCGQAYERSESYVNSAEYYKLAIMHVSDYKDYWFFRLGCVLEQLGEFEQAATYYKESRRRKFAHGVNPKGVIKHKDEEYLSYYAEYYETLPINNNQILIESFFGNNISCNPYAMLLHMLKEYGEFTYIVVIQPNTFIPSSLEFKRNVIFIKRGSDAYLRYLCTAKYLINNVTFPYYFIRREGQVYLNTWHGTPVKTLGKDIKNPFQDHANVSRNFLQATHLISPNKHTTEIMLEKYDVKDLFSGKIAETGYPRIDLGLNLTNERRIEIAKKLGFSNAKPIVFYAPTWRGTSQSKDFDVKKLKTDLKKLKSDKYNLVFRGHHLVESILSEVELDVVIAPKDIDSNELLGFCDILITDYSSIIYDVLALGKSAISYVYDFEEYKAERGLYFDKSEMIGEICSTVDEVKTAITHNLNTKYSNITQKDIQQYATFDDGHATERVVNFMLYDDKSCVYQYQQKETDIFFEGPFIPNGVSRSFLNLMSSLATVETKKNIAILINGSDVAKQQNRLEEFANLPNSVIVFSRVGTTPMTLEELWVRGKFEETYQFYSRNFEQTLLKIYQREARRLLGNSKFANAIHFEGYALFWAFLFSQINAKQHIIYQHSDKYREWQGRFPYLEGIFHLYRYYDKIISVSKKTMENNMLNLSEEFNIPKEKFEFCNNTINIEQILSSANEIIDMEKEFIDFSGTKFINIGRMSHEKDQLKLIDAFYEVHQKYTNTRLYILGDGALKDELLLKIDKLSLKDAVFLLGQKSNPFTYLKQADVFVLSSNHEGQPMVLLEALTLGTPIIATDIVGNRSVLGDDYGMLVDNTKDGLVSGMIDYIENGAKQDKFDSYTYQQDAMNKFKSLLTI